MHIRTHTLIHTQHTHITHTHTSTHTYIAHAHTSHTSHTHKQHPAFKFLSVFKWEPRKGWNFLLEAYLAEFCSHSDNVELYLLTNAYHANDNNDKDKEFDIKRTIRAFIRTKLKKKLHLRYDV